MSPTAELIALLPTGGGLAYANTLASSGSALVLSVGFDVISANAAKSAIAVAIASVSLVVLAAGGNVDWAAALPLSIGAVVGGVLAARLALNPTTARWIYRPLVVIIAGEVVQLALAGTRL